MVDLHSHIIPGVDDGARDWEVAKALLEMAAERGTTTIIATPHVVEPEEHASWADILAAVEKLQVMAPEGLKVVPGTELMLNWDLLAAYKEAPGAYCLGNTHYALVELPMFQVPAHTEEFWYELGLMGKTPVLAHPERYLELWRHPERLLKWLESGVLLQINGGSLVGRFGKEAQTNAEILLKHKVVSFMGSDAHSLASRNTDLSIARQRLLELVGPEYTEEICVTLPEKLLQDKAIYIDVPKKLQPLEKPSFWKRIFG